MLNASRVFVLIKNSSVLDLEPFDLVVLNGVSVTVDVDLQLILLIALKVGSPVLVLRYAMFFYCRLSLKRKQTWLLFCLRFWHLEVGGNWVCLVGELRGRFPVPCGNQVLLDRVGVGVSRIRNALASNPWVLTIDIFRLFMLGCCFVEDTGTLLEMPFELPKVLSI